MGASADSHVATESGSNRAPRRVCEGESCDTILSRYNPTGFCSACGGWATAPEGDRCSAGSVADLMVEIGLPLTGAPATPPVSLTSARARRHRRRERIAAYVHDGLSNMEIAELLDSSKGSIGVEITLMRRDGWNLPYRQEPAQRTQLAA